MARQREADIEHLLRRAAFGATEEEVNTFARLGFLGFSAAAAHLINYPALPDDVDSAIGNSSYVRVSPGFAPATNIADARQRWLFRMVHSRRPLQEKLALFWHNHFATAYSKIQGEVGGVEATRMLAARPSEAGAGTRGQLELFRESALGNFRDLLVAVAQDPAMLVWLDGRSNVRTRPQENFARELMELFTMGVGTFAETDVYAGARVFTGWNLAPVAGGRFVFRYDASQHDTAAKEFTFPIYPNGDRTIPARSPSAGIDDGFDLINAVARHPATGPRLVRKLYAYFINDVDAPDAALIDELATIYYSRHYEIEPIVRRLLLSTQFRDPTNYYKRYSWPVEYVVRALKEVGWVNFPATTALSSLVNMGQQLFEPPDVNGWELGPGWFSSGAMLGRMNFAAQLASDQRVRLQQALSSTPSTPDALLSELLDRLTPPAYSTGGYAALTDYVRAGPAWTGSSAQVQTKAAGLVHLILGSGEYQFI
jgi:uncharacterized protein (DUF1800 family)